MRSMEGMKRIKETIREPFASVLECKRNEGKWVLGYYPADFPEELFHAAGSIPFCIFGSDTTPWKADAHFPAFVDSLAKSFLHHGLAGDLNFLDGLVTTHMDDTTRVLSSICKENWPVPFYEDFAPPKRTDTSEAKSYLIGELQRMRSHLERFCQHKIDERALRSSIKVYNRDRSLLRKIKELRLQFPSLLSNRDFYDLLKSSMLMLKETHISLLEQIYQEMLNEISRKKERQDPYSAIPILLTGYVSEPAQIYDVIDELKGWVVADDLVGGARYFETDISEDGDPLEGIADRLLNLPSSPFFNSNRSREVFLWEQLEQSRAKGVVFVQLKFCEAVNYDYPNLKDFFRRRDIPTVLIETELQMTHMDQIRTHLKTFFELVGGV